MNTTSLLDPPAPSHQSSTGTQNVPALCVDLDGTLLATDTFLESMIILLKRNPFFFLFSFPLWAFRGMAYLKQQIAHRVTLDVTSLPYRQDVLNFIKQEFHSGRKLVLATGADQKFAQAVGNHLNIFSEIMASDGVTNFVGKNKRQGLESRFGFRGFDYIGDASPDLEVWKGANNALIVSSSANLLDQTGQHTHVLKHFPKPRLTATIILKALRVPQWIKNTLIFLPLAGTPLTVEASQLFAACMAFFSYSFCASSLYILNDVIDLPADRRHQKKRMRPFASGVLPLRIGIFGLPILLVAGFSIALWTLPASFVSILGLYCFMTMGYSLYLKKLLMIDVLTLAGFYTLRVIAGGLALGIPVSSWLLAFCLFFFLSLAFSKRHSELQFRKVSTHQGVERRAYIGGDKEMLGTMGTISGYMSVLVLALYINSQEVVSAFQNPEILWLACPLLLYWISRTWMLAHRGILEDDPLVTAFQDPRSYVIGLAMGVLGFLAM